jgi:hypothetical protein
MPFVARDSSGAKDAVEVGLQRIAVKGVRPEANVPIRTDHAGRGLDGSIHPGAGRIVGWWTQCSLPLKSWSIEKVGC